MTIAYHPVRGFERLAGRIEPYSSGIRAPFERATIRVNA